MNLEEQNDGIEVSVDEVLAAYDAEIARLNRENIMLKLQLRRLQSGTSGAQ